LCFDTHDVKEQAMSKQYFNPALLNPTNGYTHVVAADGGRTIYVSGQVSVNERGVVIGKGDPRAQVERVFANLKTCLAAAGASFNDVVKINYYVVDLKPESVSIIREVRKKHLNADHPPASTLVGISALVDPDWMLEVELIAVV